MQNKLHFRTRWLQTAICTLILLFSCGNAWGTSVTYQHVFNAKPSTGNNVTLSSVSWNISATNLNGYNSANYAGVQFGTSKANGSISLTSSSAWGSSGTYNGKTKITEIRLWFNRGGSSVTPSVTIGGVSAVSDGTVVAKNSSAGSDWTKTSKVTFTPGTNGNSGVVVISASSTNAGYICCMEIDCEEPGGGCSNTVTLNHATPAPSHGSFVLKAGSASGSTIASGGTTNNCGTGTTSVVVVPTPDKHYHVASVTATNTATGVPADDISGPDGSGNYTISYAQGSDVTSTVTVTFAEDTKHTLTFYNNGVPTGETLEIYHDSTFYAMYDEDNTLSWPTSSSACHATSTSFAGWTTENIGTTPVHTVDVDKIIDPWTAIDDDYDLNALWATIPASATETFAAADYTSETAPFTKTKNNISLYVEAGSLYTGSPYTFTVTSGTSHYFSVTASNKVLAKLVTTSNDGTYCIGSVSDGSLSSSSTASQTITGINTNSVWCFAKSNKQIRMQTCAVYCYDNYITACGACTAPDHVTVTGRWDRFGGETISLTATAYDGSDNEITTGITGYLWEKLVGSTWTAISDGTVGGVTTSGATTGNLQIANCGAGNSGKYRCTISTGASCSTASATATDGSQGFDVKVYVLECYTGETTVYNFTRIGETQAGTAQVPLSTANTAYTFKVHADNIYYGNNGTVNEDITNWVLCNSSNGGSCASNLTINSGLGGTFTIGIEYSTSGNSSVEGEPEISVTYPRKTIYFSPGDWNAGNAKFAIYYFRKVGDVVYGDGFTDFISANDCGTSTTIPQWNGVSINAVRLNENTTASDLANSTNHYEVAWGKKWNQTSNITITSDNYVSITGWGPENGDSPYSYGVYAMPTYTISYAAGDVPAGGGSITGSKASESKTCGTDFTLPSSAVFETTGYTQDGWATSDGGSKDYNLGGSYTTNAAQTFYPHWAANPYTITLNKNGGAEDGTASVDYDATALTSITHVTRAGHTLTGYWTAAEGGNKVLNADGTFYESAPAAYVSSGRWVQADNCTLYAQWTNTHAGKVFDLVTNLSELGDGKEIVILGINNNNYFAMSTDRGNNRLAIASSNDEFTMSYSNETVTLGAATTVQVLTLEATGTSNEYELNAESGYLKVNSSSSNNLVTTSTHNTADTKFTIGYSNGDFTIIATNSTYTRKEMRFNYNSNNPALFSCYASNSGNPTVLIYVEHETCDDTFDDLELSTSANAISTVSGYNTATLSTEGGNGGTVNYSVSPSSGWSIVGSTFTATSAGTYTITASQLKNGDKCRATSNSVTITATTPSIEKNKTSLDYGESCTGHDSELTFTLTGSNLLGNVTLTLGGTNPGDFSVTSPITPTAGAVSETVTVTCSPTATGSRSATLTIASTGVDDQTINLSCTGITCYDIEWYAGDDDPYQTTGVKSGEQPVFPSNPASCESGAGKSTYFYGWATDAWSGKATDLEDSKLSGITIYRKASDMPAVSAAGTKYYAVWAKADGDEAPATYAGTGTFTKITTLDELEVGAHYVLYGIKDQTVGAMNNTFSSPSSGKYIFGASSVSISSNQITNPAAAVVWKLGGEEDAYTLYSQNSSKYAEITLSDSRGYNNPSEATTSFKISVSEGNFLFQTNASCKRCISIYNNSGTAEYRAYASNAAELGTINLYKYGTTLTFSNFMTNCCTPSGLAFDGEHNYQTFVRQDIKGAHGGNGSATDEQGKATLTLGYTTSSTGTCTVEVKKLTGGDKRSTSAAGSDASNHTTISVDGTEKEVTFSIWTYGSTYPTNNGQGTYRIKLTQAAEDPYCQTVAYYFVDVVLRDKFVDAVNGNTFSNADGDGTAKATPLESARDAAKDDDCHETTRRLIGWVNEVDMDSWYGTGQDKTTNLDDKANDAKLVAPGASITTSGSTWYAIWGEEVTTP